MANQVAQQMLEQKEKESNFAILKDDGDQITGVVKDIKNITKTGYGGEEVEVLRTTLEVNYDDVGNVEKYFDNGSRKWLQEIIEKNVETGMKITITRHGKYKSNQTYYTIEVHND